MATIGNDEVEAKARAILREQITRSAWSRRMSRAERQAAIEKDVDRWWSLKAEEAAKRLVERVAEPGGGR